MEKGKIPKVNAAFYLHSNQLELFNQCTPEEGRANLLRKIISAGLENIDKHQTEIKAHHNSRKKLHLPKEDHKLRVPPSLLEKLIIKSKQLKCCQSDIVSYYLNAFIDTALEKEFVGNSNNKIKLDDIATLLHTTHKQK